MQNGHAAIFIKKMTSKSIETMKKIEMQNEEIDNDIGITSKATTSEAEVR